MYFTYYLVDESEVVYVGHTGQLAQRISQHRSNKKFNEFSAKIFETKSEAMAFERFEISRINPKLNTNNRSDGGCSNDAYFELVNSMFDDIEKHIDGRNPALAVIDVIGSDDFLSCGVSAQAMISNRDKINALSHFLGVSVDDLQRNLDIEKLAGRKLNFKK